MMGDVLPFPLRPIHQPCPCGDNDGAWCSLSDCPYPCPQAMARFRERPRGLPGKEGKAE